MPDEAFEHCLMLFRRSVDAGIRIREQHFERVKRELTFEMVRTGKRGGSVHWEQLRALCQKEMDERGALLTAQLMDIATNVGLAPIIGLTEQLVALLQPVLERQAASMRAAAEVEGALAWGGPVVIDTRMDQHAIDLEMYVLRRRNAAVEAARVVIHATDSTVAVQSGTNNHQASTQGSSDCLRHTDEYLGIMRERIKPMHRIQAAETDSLQEQLREFEIHCGKHYRLPALVQVLRDLQNRYQRIVSDQGMFDSEAEGKAAWDEVRILHERAKGAINVARWTR